MMERLAFHLVAGAMHALSKNSLGAEQCRQPICIASNPTADSFDKGFLATTFVDMWESGMLSMRGQHGRATDEVDMSDNQQRRRS